ncbi:hypothetical protein CONLIGDRAFT_646505 [Coniochaeta ligniaria NRRL 30616]|uniref:DUF7730 domain-containing protein n=1 Tax=Coniochaeta ligniaria NRRL 30616 TaxID=1408157 RepID=A0A1J7J951_9PEZI|nr:hypothetical protein CONLIGDRAFT_646505 [Coniochaeta ligniaria NRRL 30616]
MDTQEQSPFFSLPPEVRDAIYTYILPNAIHVFLREGKVAISTCMDPEIAGFLTGRERIPSEEELVGFGERSSQTVWARRLRSSWGPHWQCEEIAQRTTGHRNSGGGESVMATLLVCRRMFLDISKVLVSDVVYHVTDLNTLDYLVQIPPTSEPQSSWYEALTTDARLIKKLDLTLRLPLSFFQTLADHMERLASSIEMMEVQQPSISASLSSAVDDSLLNVWIRVWPALASRLRQLQRLHVWVDHDDTKSWSLVDERSLLSYIATWISRDRIHCLEGVTFNLPKLHPRHENPGRHFTKDSPQPPPSIMITRRLRQCHFPVETIPGIYQVADEPDFPVLFELVDATADTDQPMSLEEVEEMERDMWQRGEDPNEFLWDLAGPGARCGV